MSEIFSIVQNHINLPAQSGHGHDHPPYPRLNVWGSQVNTSKLTKETSELAQETSELPPKNFWTTQRKFLNYPKKTAELPKENFWTTQRKLLNYPKNENMWRNFSGKTHPVWVMYQPWTFGCASALSLSSSPSLNTSLSYSKFIRLYCQMWKDKRINFQPDISEEKSSRKERAKLWDEAT